MKAKTYSSSSELHGADEKGYLSFGVVDAWHGASYGAHVGVLATLHWLSGGACRAGGYDEYHVSTTPGRTPELKYPTLPTP